MTFDIDLGGLQQDGTFAPGSNATWNREHLDKPPKGCPIEGFNK